MRRLELRLVPRMRQSFKPFATHTPPALLGTLDAIGSRKLKASIWLESRSCDVSRLTFPNGNIHQISKGTYTHHGFGFAGDNDARAFYSWRSLTVVTSVNGFKVSRLHAHRPCSRAPSTIPNPAPTKPTDTEHHILAERNLHRVKR